PHPGGDDRRLQEKHLSIIPTHHHEQHCGNSRVIQVPGSCHQDKFLVCANILGNKACSDSDTFGFQWICCDIRYLDVSILGKFAVVMADPPWDIHMELPYGTLTDDEMRKLNIPILQDDGFLFLWVTGRAMELGRECLSLWGYERVDEIIWVKTNQLQRIIRTGRTGHWLNHSKEHCLVGVKGNPQGFNRKLDCDVIVAEVRGSTHNFSYLTIPPRCIPPASGTRKIELFGRPHNLQPNCQKFHNSYIQKHNYTVSIIQKKIRLQCKVLMIFSICDQCHILKSH
uniref:mRNA m(6)A methyltransferase n=1 Tax=Scleropages formosus TaxID=113540 RepID=A0A8D0CL67_SCLFO